MVQKDLLATTTVVEVVEVKVLLGQVVVEDVGGLDVLLLVVLLDG